jgi:hypothetical protein
MQYLDEEGEVVYKSKDGKDTKVFPVLEWLAAMCSHIPNLRRANGEVLRILQQRVAGQTPEGRSG